MQGKHHLSTKTTSRMLTRPKTTARRAGAVYMLSCSLMTCTVTPFSPMNERLACRADTCKDIQMLTQRFTHHSLYSHHFVGAGQSYLVPGWSPGPDRHSCWPWRRSSPSAMSPQQRRTSPRQHCLHRKPKANSNESNIYPKMLNIPTNKSPAPKPTNALAMSMWNLLLVLGR